jgi:hypothetical protein
MPQNNCENCIASFKAVLPPLKLDILSRFEAQSRLLLLCRQNRFTFVDNLSQLFLTVHPIS